MTEQEKQEIARWHIELGLCPDCKSNLIHISGCDLCQYCGWSACSN